jgi:integrase
VTREIIKMLNRFFGSVLLHEITSLRIEQFKRDRLAGRWSAHKQKGSPKSVQAATVNRELDTLKSIFTKAVEWKRLVESPARDVKRLRVNNRRTRILTPDEQQRLLAACSRKLRAIVMLALVTGARIGELLELPWEHCQNGYLTFLETKNGRVRKVQITPTIQAILTACRRCIGGSSPTPRWGSDTEASGRCLNGRWNAPASRPAMSPFTRCDTRH